VPRPETLHLFALACAGLVLLPGPALIFIVTRGVVHDRLGGLISNVIAAIGDSVFALAAASACGRLRRWLHSRRPARTSGVIYLGLGAVAALSHSHTTKS
jgi:threonine/homoserine/homoserine lactone efflux protein